jgi:acetyl-CoA C-acetyltransferase
MSGHESCYVVGAYEHPTRYAPEKALAQMHAEVAIGALRDAGLTKDDIDGYFCAGDAPGLGPLSMVNYLNLRVRHFDSTDVGGNSYIAHASHAVQAIRAGKCNVALITMSGKPRSERVDSSLRAINADWPEYQWEFPFGMFVVGSYALCAQRHMFEYGTTSEQLAWIKVAASHHAQYNPNAMLRKVVTVEEVVNSPLVSSPLHRLDCCVISDGGGALIIARPEVARSLSRPLVKIRATAEAIKHHAGGNVDITSTAAAISAPVAFAEAGIRPADIQYASIYDSFTINVVMLLEDAGFCEKGKGGRFVEDGNLISGVGKLPFNTDGGGLCSNHPQHRGGMPKMIEAIRQLRGEAHPKVQVPNCALAVVQGTGGVPGGSHSATTCIMERE